MKIREVLSRARSRYETWWALNRSSTIRHGVGAGLEFNLRNASNNYIRGTIEAPVQKALAYCLKPGDVFYDIGANVGFFSVIAARLVGPSGHVYAFEPVPENAAGVRLNARLNDFHNITVYQKAVSSSTGKGKLLLAQHPGGHMLATPDTTLNSGLMDLKGVMMADLVSIDDLVAEKTLTPPALVKIDVEGVELDVLRGMSDTIKEFSPVIIYETDDQVQDLLTCKNERVDGFLRSLGYEIRVLESAYAERAWKVRHALAIPKLVSRLCAPVSSRYPEAESSSYPDKVGDAIV